MLLEAAQRFEAEGRHDVADALYQMILQRFGGTPAADAVRRILASLPAERDTRSGAVELQVWSTLYGLWLGVGVPLMMGSEDAEPYGVGLLVGGPTGFLIARSYARSRSLSEGQARAITWGGTWGSWQGFGWAQALDVGEREEFCPEPGQCFDAGGDNGEEIAAMMLAGGLAGIASGVLLSRKPISAGLATTVNFGSLWGTWFGFALAVLMDQEDDALLGGTLIGGNVGLITTAVLAPRWQLSRNRARLISIAGVAGGLGGAGLDLLFQPDDEKAVVAIPLVTSIIGLVIGAATTKRYDAVATRGGGDMGGAALLRFDRGRLQLDAPVVTPTLIRVPTRSPRWLPALSISLLNATF